ncbi:hypothetical protein EON63_23545 [archaeon]|nr:MAG: hypothetical protein EON63_23545 [archaeon]
MYIGEPLFGGTTQADQMCRIVDVLGMPPLEMVRSSPEKTRNLVRLFIRFVYVCMCIGAIYSIQPLLYLI